MPLKLGLEKEFFVKNNEGQFILPEPIGLSYDECGYLCEARGAPATDVITAVFNLKSEEYRLRAKAASRNAVLDDSPVVSLPKNLLLEGRRRYAKGVISYRNFKGFAAHRNSVKEQIAGVHVSLTSYTTITQCDYKGKNVQSVEVYRNFDWMSIFWRLDKAFAAEIKTAKRNPGFYEMKADGRVEYRSLPANVDLDKLTTVLLDIRAELGI